MPLTPRTVLTNLEAIRDNMSPINSDLSPHGLRQFHGSVGKLTEQIQAKITTNASQRHNAAPDKVNEDEDEDGGEDGDQHEDGDGDQDGDQDEDGDGEDGEGNIAGSAKLARRAKVATKVSIAVSSQKRVHNVISAIGQPPINPDMWASMISAGAREGVKVAEVEDNALKAILRGYDDSDLKKWKRAVHALSEAPGCPESLTEFKEADTVMDMKKRLIARQEVLRLSSNGVTSDIYHRYVLNQIASIKFDMDWEKMGQGEGGTQRKSRFYEAAYCVERGGKTDDPRLESKGKALVTKEAKEYEQWRRKLGHTLTARNRAKVAYRGLGSGIFMDPFWDAGILVPNKRTKEFTHVLAEVVKFVRSLDGEAEQAVDNVRKGTERVRKSIMGKLDPGLEIYVQNFRFECQESGLPSQ